MLSALKKASKDSINLDDAVSTAAETQTDTQASSDQVRTELATLRAAVDGAQTAIMMVDRDFIVTYVNEQTKDLLATNEAAFQTVWPDFKATDILGTCIDRFHTDPSHQRKLLSDPSRLPWRTDIAIADLSFELTVSAQIAPNGDYIGNTLEWADVTEKRKRERENADFRSQITAIGRSQAVIAFTPEGNILDANENFTNATGYSLDEIVGQHHSMFVEPGYAESDEYKALWNGVRNGEYSAQIFKRVKKNGDTLWLNASYNPIFDETGKVFKVVKFATNVTDQIERGKKSEAINKKVDALLEQIDTAIGGVAQSAQQANKQSDDTATRVQSVAAAAEQFAGSANEIAQSMVRSTQDVQAAIEEAGSADTSTNKLTELAGSMSGIVDVINQIASQINLLALNATIEAARAGEAGRGFSVVASEVKSLANQVSKATEQISSEITAVQNVSQDVVERLNGINTRVQSVHESVTGVAAAVDEQTATTRDITSSLQSAASSVEQVSAGLSDIYASVEEARGQAAEGKTLYRSLQAELASA